MNKNKGSETVDVHCTMTPSQWCNVCVCCVGKVLKELIEPYPVRVERLTEFLRDVRPSLQVEIVALDDPFGVSVVDRQLQCIVVSEETRRGGEAVNAKRLENVRPSSSPISFIFMYSERFYPKRLTIQYFCQKNHWLSMEYPCFLFFIII